MKAIPNLDFAVVKPTELSLKVFVGMLRKIYQNLTTVINGNIGFGDGTNPDNVSGNWINVTTPVAPNTDFTVNHNLSRLPVGYWIMQKDRAVDIYTGGVVATTTQITLRATVASAVVRLFVICFLLAFGTSAQTTNITLQVTDAGAQSWNNGTWSVVLSSPPGAIPFGPPFTITGSSTSVPNQTQSGTLSGSGSATMTLTQNAFISPTLSRWNYTVCPQAGPTSCFTQGVVVTSTTSITLAPPAISVNAGPGVSVYTTSEVAGASIGSQVFLLGTGLQVCSAVSGNTCTSWASAGGLPSGLTYVAPTLTVSAAGSGNGVLALSGNTSGTATFTAPAVAGTNTNAVISSNVFAVPDGGTGSPSIQRSAASNTGFYFIGNSPAIDVGGTNTAFFNALGLNTLGMQSSGTAAALTGTGACATITTQTGGAWSGRATCTGATAASTLTITPGTTATNGWICQVQDQTTRANALQQTSTTTTACTLTATSVTQNDVIVFTAFAF
jgi:hypothetical protein